jgi:hypothetical protein
MLTTSHTLMAAVATTRPGMRAWLITVGWLGGFFPDVSMFLMVGASRAGMTGQNVWRAPDGLYWVDPWLSLSDYSHSIPIWALVVLSGYIAMRRGSGTLATVGLAAVVFGCGALLHSVVDLLTHTDDAHAHFRPLTDWRFIDGISYYRTPWFRTFETLLGVAMAAYLIWRFKQWPVRILAFLMAAPPLLMQFIVRAMF